jgi:hypothetical protein
MTCGAADHHVADTVRRGFGSELETKPSALWKLAKTQPLAPYLDALRAVTECCLYGSITAQAIEFGSTR